MDIKGCLSQSAISRKRLFNRHLLKVLVIGNNRKTERKREERTPNSYGQRGRGRSKKKERGEEIDNYVGR